MSTQEQFKNIKGTRDILPEEAKRWEYMESVIRSNMERYNYQQLRFPTFEDTELFRKSTGEETDIVQKEMYTFEDSGGRSITLKPEGTPSVIRMYIQHGLKNRGKLQKYYYIERMFRQEKPQKGRFREFTQFGAEAVGSPSPQIDAELIESAMDIFNQLNISNVELHINSIGCRSCRSDYIKEFKQFISDDIENFCEDCQRRFKTNPLRILDCKKDREKLEDAPRIIDYLCQDCQKHFTELKDYLKEAGIEYEIDTSIARGLDYYTKTVFEFVHSGLGSQNAIGGGGRYDELVEFMGGESTPASGYAVGMDRMLLLMNVEELKKGVDIYIVTLDEESDLLGWELIGKLRKEGLSCDKNYLERSIRAQFREADRQDASWTIVIGEEERSNNTVQIREMKTGKQNEIAMDVNRIKEYLNAQGC